MKASLIQDHEALFDHDHIDSDGKQFIAQEQKDFPFPLTLLTTQHSSGYYKAEEKHKDLVCLHYTCGYLKGDIATLTHPDYLVSVPFVVGRNGTVYQLFSSKFWSYHLGANAIGGNLANSQRSIAIELSNIGPLKLADDGNSLLTVYNDVYCTLAETQFYKKIEKPFRDYRYFASFTDAQYKSLQMLVQYLCDKYSIVKAFLPEASRYGLFDTDDAAKKCTGVVSHVNFRAGKTDVGPAFDWDRIA